MMRHKTIQVLGETVRIVKISSWKDHDNVEGDRFLVGRFYPDTLTIYINKNHSKECQERFLLHELNNAVLAIIGADQTLSLEMQEVLAQSFSSFYYSQRKRLFS